MLDRLLFWIVVLTPAVLTVAAIFYGRWKELSPARRAREVILFGAVTLSLVTGFLAWDLTRQADAESAHLHFREPYYLLMMLPVYGVLLLLMWKSVAGMSRGRMWLAFLLRSGVFVLLMLALAGLQMVIERDYLTVLFALDRSKSVSNLEAQRALEAIDKAVRTKRPDDKAGLLVFGGKSAIEIFPTPTFTTPRVEDLKAEVDRDATDIQSVLRRATATFEDGTARRLVVFTDGRQTNGDAIEELKRLRGIDVMVVPMTRSDFAEMLVEKIQVPSSLRWEQPFDAHIFVHSNVSAKAKVTLFTGEQRLEYPEPVELEAGQRKRVTFPGLRLRKGGPHQIEAIIEPYDKNDDTLNENNHAYTYTEVETDSRVLVLTSDLAEVEHLVKSLEGEKLYIDVRSGASLPENPEDYRRYDCIVLANLGRGFLSEPQMAVIESCVRDQGAGLVMIGGDQSFGAGGYLGTPIERALPVSMELENKKIMPSGALAIVLHSCEFADGHIWDKKIAKAAINVLSPQDYAGVIYFSFMGGERWAFRPTPVSRKRWMFSLIDQVSAGDMPDLNSITRMAVDELKKLKNVSLKHVVILTDGDPQPPNNAVVADALANKITISVTTIFPHTGFEVSAMKQLAAKTGGRYYNCDDPRKLPLIFIKEAAIVRKNLIYSDDRGIPLSLGTQAEILREFGNQFPPVRAFVVTTLKERAERHLYTIVEGEKVPVLARWRYGLGKAVAFTSDATNRWAPDWVSWGSYDKFWTNLFQWVCRQRMPSNHTVQIVREDGKAKVLVEAFDEKGQYLNFANLVGSANEPGVGQDLDAVTHKLQFVPTAPGRYEAAFDVDKQGAYTITVTDMSDPTKPSSITTGMANSYSPEFKDLERDEGLLDRMAERAQDLVPAESEAAGTPRRRTLDDLISKPEMEALFAHNLPPVQRPTELFWPLLWAALCLFPFDVAVRRLNVEPGAVAGWFAARFLGLFGFLRKKQEELVDAASDAADAATADRRSLPPLMPQGTVNREAQSRYEKAGATDEAKSMDLKPGEAPVDKPKAVGGTKLSEADQAASDYTRALLKAKRRARKKDD